MNTIWIFRIRNIQMVFMLDYAPWTALDISHPKYPNDVHVRLGLSFLYDDIIGVGEMANFQGVCYFTSFTIEVNGFQFLGHGCSLVSTTILHIYYNIKHLFCKNPFQVVVGLNKYQVVFNLSNSIQTNYCGFINKFTYDL